MNTNLRKTRPRWPAERLLQEARDRTKATKDDGEVAVQRMLSDLLVEAGWREGDFITVLLKDVIDEANRKQQRTRSGTMPIVRAEVTQVRKASSSK
jgi:hypothetical protein